MRKEPFFRYWRELERVVPVVQSQTAGDIMLTLVSLEIYAKQGFLVIFNGQSSVPGARFDRGMRGWMQARITDRLGDNYTNGQTLLSGIQHAHTFIGRAVMPCTPPVQPQAGGLAITIPAIEWEYPDGDESLPAFELLPGPWLFDIAL